MAASRSVLLLVATLAFATTAEARPRRVASLTLPGKERIRTMAVAGDTAYLGLERGRLPELVAVDLTDPRAPRIAWVLDLDTDANAIAVSERHVYVATSADDAELTIVDRDTHLVAGTFDVPGSEDGVMAQTIRDPFVWIGTRPKADAGVDEAIVLDVSDPAQPIIVTSRAASSDLRAPRPPSPRAAGFKAGGLVVGRGRPAADRSLTVLAVARRRRELQVVEGLADDIAVVDGDGDGVWRVACLGDSNTFALMDKNPGSWCQRLRQTLSHPNLVMANFGVFGAAMTPPFVSDAFLQLAEAIEFGADMAIIAFGGNDVLLSTPSEIASSARLLADEAAAAGVSASFLTIAPRVDVPGLEAKIAETNARLTATLGSAQVIDTASGLGVRDLQRDLVHLNPRGTRTIARTVRARLFDRP